MPSWPVSLPSLELDGYAETAPDVVLRSQMDAGPAKVRRRFTAGVRPIAGQVTLTAAQTATLDAFYVTDLAGGATPFDWTHPRTGAACVMRFTEPPGYTPVEQFYRATLRLEIMP